MKRTMRTLADLIRFAAFLAREWSRVRAMTDLSFEYDLERREAAVTWQDEGRLAY